MMADDFCPVPNPDVHGEFLQKVVDLLFKNVVFTSRRDKVLLWKSPEELMEEFDFSLPQRGEGQEKLLQIMKNTVKFSVKTGHPYFVNQLFSGLDPYGLAGQWLTDALNASVYTYEVAPVFTLMEQCIIKEVCRMIGSRWNDGIFCPGGSFGNGTAISLARYSRFPDVKMKGNSSLPKCVIITSEECHYSIYKFAAFLGIGEDNVVPLKTNDVGEIVPEDLERIVLDFIGDGVVVLMVVATLGTTVRGAFDPVHEMAVVCKKYKIWLHVDAAWGGGLLFSQKHRAKLNGIEAADSIVINPHKLLAVPQQCSMLLVTDPDILHRCHSRGAEYLFQKDKYYDSRYDVGDRYLQCGRKCDVFKFWLMWKAKGSSGFANHIDTLMDLAEYFEQQVNMRQDFVLVSKRQYMNVCFWYLPRYLRGKANISDYNVQLQKVAPQIKGVMVKHGAVMLNYQPLKTLPNFFRFVSQNSALNKGDVDFILDHIAEIGDSLFR
ncbi:cysteine sulfinic acid decarboxylase-like [Anthonomus grandis grandis]|uniref:cysteine sulfinic acid decarboxylase-like n=1 Tax=Anthonomus grandis grandis TaxID=2921223 RepID=UPI00216654FB|nr:cysteine sulfinic acid decarboxylase-like [Anthonomus grandis grandis]